MLALDSMKHKSIQDTVSAYKDLLVKTLQTSLKMQGRDFPGGPVVKKLPSSAGDAGSILGQGTKIPHAAGQLSPCATTTELVHLNERGLMS